jgi:hypothetical protein
MIKIVLLISSWGRSDMTFLMPNTSWKLQFCAVGCSGNSNESLPCLRLPETEQKIIQHLRSNVITDLKLLFHLPRANQAMFKKVFQHFGILREIGLFKNRGWLTKLQMIQDAVTLA